MGGIGGVGGGSEMYSTVRRGLGGGGNVQYCETRAKCTVLRRREGGM